MKSARCQIEYVFLPKIKIVATTVVFATPGLWLLEKEVDIDFATTFLLFRAVQPFQHYYLLVRNLFVKVRMWEGSHTP